MYNSPHLCDFNATNIRKLTKLQELTLSNYITDVIDFSNFTITSLKLDNPRGPYHNLENLSKLKKLEINFVENVHNPVFHIDFRKLTLEKLILSGYQRQIDACLYNK